jgi:hypothetical protein
MVHKGQRTNKHREADYPFAVDTPIPAGGLGQKLNLMIDALRPLGAEAEIWSHMVRGPRGDPQCYSRAGFKSAQGADAFARTFGYLGARRVR